MGQGSLVEFLKEISPFLAIVVSAFALIVGPSVAGRVSRAHLAAQMREKWVYSFRDLLVQITTELDMAVEKISQEGLVSERGDLNYEYMERLRKYQNSIRMMINIEESTYKELMAAIDCAVNPLLFGIKNYDDLYNNIERVKELGQQALEKEWAHILP